MDQQQSNPLNPSDRLRKMFVGIVIMNALIGLGDLIVAVMFIFKRAIEQFALDHGLIPHAIIERLSISPRAQTFAIFYFVSHGIIKLGLAGALLRNKLWAYPVAIVFFGLFSLYQVYVLLGQYSLFELALFVVNVTVLVSVSIEYRRITQTETL